MQWLDTLRSSVLALPDLAKFAVVIAVTVGIPPIARRSRLPESATSKSVIVLCQQGART
jgi:hypothetical protein